MQNFLLSHQCPGMILWSQVSHTCEIYREPYCFKNQMQILQLFLLMSGSNRAEVKVTIVITFKCCHHLVPVWWPMLHEQVVLVYLWVASCPRHTSHYHISVNWHLGCNDLWRSQSLNRPQYIMPLCLKNSGSRLTNISLSVLFSLFPIWKSKRPRISDLIQFTENPIHIFLTYLFLAEVRDPQRNLQRNFMEFRKGLLPVLIALEMIYQSPTLNIRILEIKVALPF